MDKYEIANILKAAAEGIEGYYQSKSLEIENEKLKDRIKVLIKTLLAFYQRSTFSICSTATASDAFRFFTEALSNSDSVDDSLVDEVYEKIIG